MAEQNTPRTAEDIIKEQAARGDTGKWLFSRPMDEKGYTGAYERYHTSHAENSSRGGTATLSAEKKKEIRERVAKTLAERIAQTGSVSMNPIGAEEASEDTVPSPAPQLADEQETDPAEPQPDENPLQEQQQDEAEARAIDERGILTGDGPDEPFSFTEFKMRRANAVKEFFSNMHEFTFTKTNQEAVEMLHMHPQKSAAPEQNADLKRLAEQQALEEKQNAERAENLHHIITSEKQIALLRTIVTAVLFVLSLGLLTVSAKGGTLSLLGMELPGIVIAAIDMLLMTLGGVISSNVFVGAYQLIRNKRFGKEMLAAVIYSMGLIFALFRLCVPSVMLRDYCTSYTPWYLLTMFAYHLGMRMQMGRLQKQYDMVMNQRKRLEYSLEPLENRFLLQNLDVQRRENTLVVKQVRADMLSGFETHGFAPDWFDALTKPILIGLSALALFAGVGAGMISGDWMKAIYVCTGAFAFCSPFAAMFSAELPMCRTCREQEEFERNTNQNYTILHADAVEDMAEAGAIIMGSEALFPPESVVLHGLRSAAGVRVDEAILDAVSILHAGKSVLAPTFMQMISDKTELLKSVDSITYEDGMGISAWVDNNRVLIGSRKMMENHNIRMPSKEIEQAEADKGRMILYLARQGELITAFSLTLQVLPQVARLLGQARSQGMHIYIKSVDCLIENNLKSLFGADADVISILPSRLHADYDKETNRKDAALSLILSDGSAFSAMHAVMQLQRLRAALERNRLLVVILLILTGLIFASAAMVGYPAMIASTVVIIPAALHAAIFLLRR